MPLIINRFLIRIFRLLRVVTLPVDSRQGKPVLPAVSQRRHNLPGFRIRSGGVLPKKLVFLFPGFIIGCLLAPESVTAQTSDPSGAFLRSLAVPGWGHYYADNQNWNRGKLHLAADILLITGLTGSAVQERNLRNKVHTQASLKAGVDTRQRERSFLLAVGGYQNLDEYNDVQLRSRNWHQIYPDEPGNRWEWQDEVDRQHYNDLRVRSENAKNRVPMIAGVMVVNRVISAISAYNRARTQRQIPELLVSPVYISDHGIGGYMGTLRFTY